jgi:hypothetical protein
MEVNHVRRKHKATYGKTKKTGSRRIEKAQKTMEKREGRR